MPIPNISILSGNDKDLIHERSLDLLQEVGIKFNSKRAVTLLAEAGCHADWDSLAIKFPREFIEKALTTLPAKILLAGKDPNKDVFCGNGSLVFCSPGGETMIRDIETRERRPANTEDLLTCLRVVESMPEIHEWCPMVIPMELPPRLRALKTCQLSLCESSKHMLGSPETREELPYFLEMIDAVVGHRNRLKKRPIFSAIASPVSPLQNSGVAVDNLLDMVEFTPPIFMQFLPLSGATAPITLAGTVVQANAEFLGNMALYQTATSGWPIIWAAAVGSIDMRTGVYVGGPETMLTTLSLIEMAKHYHVPVNTFGSSAAETQTIGYRTGMESMFGLLVSALAQADHMWWPADMDRLNTCDLPLTVMSTEAVRQIERMRKGFAFDETYMLFDTIKKMAFEADYLGDPSTKKFFREEHLQPELFPRVAYEEWSAAGKPTDESIAIARLKDMLSSYEPVLVDETIRHELESIYMSAEKKTLS